MTGRPSRKRAEFVARGTYRHRRMIDAAGLLPVLGALLFAVPLLWLGAGGAAPRTSHVMLYLFAVWALLVALSALVTRGIGTGGDAAPDEDADLSELGEDRGDDRGVDAGDNAGGGPARPG